MGQLHALFQVVAGAMLLVVAPAASAQVPQPLGSEFQVNTATGGEQYGPQACMRGDGTFFVSWTDPGPNGSPRDGSSTAAVGRVFDSAGMAVGNDFVVNSYTTAYQSTFGSTPRIGCAGSNDFVVAWGASNSSDGGYIGIGGSAVSAAGSPSGSPIRFDGESDPATEPDVCMRRDGTFLAVWQTMQFMTPIKGRRYAASGAPLGDEETIIVGVARETISEPSVCCHDDGFVVTFSRFDFDGVPGTAREIFGQRFTTSATQSGTEFMVNEFTTGEQRSSRAACARDGRFVVAWESQSTSLSDADAQDGDRTGIFARAFTANGDPLADPFQVNTYTTGHQEDHGVTMNDSGEFVVVWASPQEGSSNRGIFGQVFASGGQPLGTELHINEVTDGQQRTPSVSAGGAGLFAVVWQSDDDGDQEGVAGRVFSIGTSTGTTTTTTLPSGGDCGDPVVDGGLVAAVPDGPSVITASDALYILGAAVGVRSCELCVCDVNDSGGITATDALAALNEAVGLPIVLDCPPCS